MGRDSISGQGPTDRADLPPLLLTQEQAWRYCGFKRSKWFLWRKAGKTPTAHHIPGVGVRYYRAELEAFVLALLS